MSDESTTLESGTQTIEASTEAPDIDVSTIDENFVREAARKGDRDTVRAIIERAAEERGEAKKETPAPEKVTAAITQPTEKKKIWQLKYRGAPVELDDADGYLGLKDFGGLKKNAAYLKTHASKLEKEIEETKAALYSKDIEAKAAVTLRSELASLKNELSILKKPSNVLPFPEKKDALVAPKAKLVPPVEPKDDLDPLDESSIKEWNAFNRASAVFTKQVAELLESGGNVSQLPEEVIKQEIAMLRAEVEKTKPLINDIEIAKKSQQKENLKASFWKMHSDFQARHKEYATKKSLEELEPEFFKFQDSLAIANGLQVPNKPYNLNDLDWKKYEADSLALVDRYIEGDADVKANAENITPPEDYDKYHFNINLARKRKEYIADGILSGKATLHDAFIKWADETGGLEKAHADTARENLAKGVQSTVNAMKNVQQTYATTIPAEVTDREVLPGVTTNTDLERILRSRDPKDREAKQIILEKIKNGEIAIT